VKVEVGLAAASIASIIAMAGDEIVMAHNAMFMMIQCVDHWRRQSARYGTMSATLSKIDDALARTYAARRRPASAPSSK
jgi:ATP-dependent protease ClpP protease subunit